MKRAWNIPVDWQVCGVVEIVADSFEEAIEKAKSHPALPTPKNSIYIDGSYQLNQSMIDDLESPETELLSTEFQYGKLKIKGFREFTKVENDFQYISLRLNDIQITPEAWSYDEFYRRAELHGCGDCDLFVANDGDKDVIVIPTSNTLFEWRENN